MLGAGTTSTDFLPLEGQGVTATGPAADSPILLILGLLLCCAALAAVYLAIFPPCAKISLQRTVSPSQQPSVLAGFTATATRVIENLLTQIRGAPALSAALEAAGLRLKPAEFIIIVASSTVVVAGVLLPIGGPLTALFIVATGGFGAKFLLGYLAGRRRASFNDQLDDSLQLMASGLRAGHSLLRAIDALSAEAETPTSEEFARIINETRLGRDVGQALDATAERMKSEDFLWVAQAIAIHREVGGNLAEVLDQVGQTIRERNQIRRQIQTLSAEGRISALVLMILPFGLGGILVLITPGYLTPLFDGPIGYAMVATAAILLVAGGLWLRKVISFKF
ncbi:type II secretion system F family protein [Arthrobacter wenxiniae]|uniref:Type II secretion system F family protein n=1 Tax=Arthrobacter wenxiniae TaxID=2713570 RepID=A0A7Y7IFC0_9MICC|nr:type II secretion system F family protein [Arthrobacter wenxiniae]NVM94444.1 type II secretion system F family protein [Arthrobacter wenxiniae]